MSKLPSRLSETPFFESGSVQPSYFAFCVRQRMSIAKCKGDDLALKLLNCRRRPLKTGLLVTKAPFGIIWAWKHLTIMKTTLLLSATVLMMGAFAAHGQDTNNMTPTPPTYTGGSSWYHTDSDELYRLRELSLEAFGAASSDWRRDGDYFGDHHHHDTEGGGGAGLEYCFCRYVGVEVESFALANSYNTTSAVGGNLVLRWPIGETGFSPYIFGGGGHEWTYQSEGYADGGVGLEYRFTHSIGLFGDARFVAPDDTRNYGMGRIGVRFTF
jgi:hypothetical protein